MHQTRMQTTTFVSILSHLALPDKHIWETCSFASMTGQGFVEFAHLESIQQNPDTYMTYDIPWNQGNPSCPPPKATPHKE